MKKTMIITSILTLALIFSACSKTPEAQPMEPSETPVETPAEEPEEEPAETPVEEPVEVKEEHRYEQVAEGLSPISGLPYEGDGKVIMVQMENTKKARPHSGLSEASLIYEMEVESTITRLTTFFHGSYPEKAGPVRSTRKQHMFLWREWNYLYIFFGGSNLKPGQDIYDWMAELDITAKKLDGTKTGKGFSRSTDRVAPHNAYTNLKEVMETAYDFEPVNRTLYFDEDAVLMGEPAKKIALSYSADNNITYEYQEESGEYRRFINGEPMMDKESDTQIAVRNIIVQHANHFHVTDTVYTNIDLVGSGAAEYFTDGIMRKGTWERKDAESLTRYYDEEGEEIAIKPGKTFIQIMRNESQVSFE